jgi:uncharacterized protein (TIGR02391 family)
MDKKKAIELLQQAINDIPHLAALSWDNQEFKLWRDKILDILEASFGHNSTEYERFSGAFPNVISFDDQQDYWDELKMRETALKSIIQKYEILRTEEKPAEKIEQKDTAQFPIKLFDAMEFYPRVVEASRPCFVSGNYREAILNAFIALIDYIKEKTKLTTDTKDLMTKAFNLDNPVIKLNSLKEQYERDEQEGFRFLYMGAVVGIRNPKAHKLIPQSNPLHTLEYLAFASLLMRRVEEGELTA